MQMDPCISDILQDYYREMCLPDITERLAIMYILYPEATVMGRLLPFGQRRMARHPRKSVIFIMKNSRNALRN